MGRQKAGCVKCGTTVPGDVYKVHPRTAKPLKDGEHYCRRCFENAVARYTKCLVYTPNLVGGWVSGPGKRRAARRKRRGY